MKSSTRADSGVSRKITDRAVGFLTDVLGFASERVNERVISRITELFDTRQMSTADCEAAIIAAATVGETYFLRHPDHFSWLTERWLPRCLDIFGSPPPRPIRVLCAGCSTGEEAYSVAAMLRRDLPRGLDDIRIDAFDVNIQFLQRARRAEYRTWSLRGVQLEDHRDWLELDGSTVSVRPALCEHISFVEHNLLEPVSSNPALRDDYDLILCRNVLLYFHRRAVDTAYWHLSEALSDQGVLLPGPSDPAPTEEIPLERWRDDGVRHFRQYDGAVASSRRRNVSTSEAVSEPTSSGESPRREHGSNCSESAVETTERRERREDDEFVDTADVCRIARNLSRVVDTRLATKFLERHLQQHPVDVKAHVLGTQYAAELGDFDRAFRWGRRAVYLAPDAPWVTYLMVNVCRRSGRYKMVNRYLNWTRQLLEDCPGDKRLRYSDDCTVRQLREVLDGLE